MENIINGDTLVIVVAVLAALLTLSEGLASSDRFKSNSTIQLTKNVLGGLLKLLKRG